MYTYAYIIIIEAFTNKSLTRPAKFMALLHENDPQN